MLTLMSLILDLLLKQWQLGLKGMGEYLSVCPKTFMPLGLNGDKPEQNWAMSLINPPWIPVNVINAGASARIAREIIYL